MKEADMANAPHPTMGAPAAAKTAEENQEPTAAADHDLTGAEEAEAPPAAARAGEDITSTVS